ncbi:MAG: DNA internalization-related competence protein ComEC/Rec2 [Deltaproteobacteria bacterium]|nr:DNA internalization-related competence protein ComEC/Rec2 [Deltaproteobacteria bacterium]
MTSAFFSRPLIPLSLSFGAGILAADKALPFHQSLILPVFLSAAVVFIFCLFRSRFRVYLLLPAFFLTGALLEMGTHRPSPLVETATLNMRVTVEGVVMTPPLTVHDTAKFRVRVTQCFFDGAVRAVRDKDLMVTVYRPGLLSEELRPGKTIRFPARLRPFRNFNNPGGYDYESAMSMKGYACAAYVSDGRYVVPMGEGSAPFSVAVLEGLRRPVRAFLQMQSNPDVRGLFQALILGDRRHIGETLRESFIRSGLGHALAVSGLHIGLIAWIAFTAFKWLLARSYRLILAWDIRRPAAALTCIPVVGYAFLSGFHVSSQRAMVMVLAYLGSMILGREKETWSTLALAGLAILALDPHALFSASFQLSFMAVIGILWFVPGLMDRFPKTLVPENGRGVWLNRVYIYALGLVTVSFTAMIFLLPVTLYYFHRVSLVAVAANVTAVPILGLWVLPLGLLSTAVLFFSQTAAGAILQLAAWGAEIMMELIRFWADLPFASLWVVTPSFLEAALFYGLAACLYYAGRGRWAKVGIALLLALALADAGYWVHRVRFHKDLRVTFLDVGQGSSALVEFPGGKTMLIDGGGFPGGRFDVGGMVVAPALWRSKIGRIDTLVLTHPQADHMNGLRFIARAFSPDAFWSNGDRAETPAYRELMGIIEEEGIERLYPRDLADGREINGVGIRLLHPLPGNAFPVDPLHGGGLNDNSVVLKITYGKTSFLFTGDVERAGEDVLVETFKDDLAGTILQVPHHGSRTSGSESFLGAVRPDMCVISCRDRGRGRFPHAQTLERLEKTGCRVLRTDRSGAITFTVNSSGYDVKTYCH